MGFDEIALRAGFRPGQRRSFLLLLALTVIYVGVAVWMLVTGWVRVMTTTPIRPEAVTLYVALALLTAFPIAMRFLYSSFLVRQLERATEVLDAARDSARTTALAKADFLATMSHEIRTPLNAVIGFSQLLDSVSVTGRQREYAAAIRESSAHLQSIVNDVLDYSKIEAGHVELDERPVDVRALVEGCVQAVSLEAANRGLEVGYEIGEGTPAHLFSDATRIRQVLLNLLSNAVKFTERGQVHVTTRAVRERRGRHRVSFEVRDTGIGIAEADQKRLFKAFTQVDPSPTRSHGGTGLGLAISWRLCGLMGGDLTVESRPGKGSTFVATIRAAAAPDAGQVRAAPTALRGLRLLVVDDAVTRAVVARNALAWGMVIRSTGDPDQAMAWVRAGDPFDVAILGSHGKVDAQTLAEQLRAAGRATLPLVLAFPGRNRAPRVPKPFVAQLRKPIQAAHLLKATWAAVGQSHPEPGKRARPAVRLRVLLVEDNAMNEMLALRVLEDLGYRADVARNGLEAVEAVTRKRYDIVLMDVQMPVMDGLEATRTIYRRLPRRDRPLIVGLSANALPGDREQCLRAGMDDYTPKPMDQARLAAILEAASRRGRKARATPHPAAAAVT